MSLHLRAAVVGRPNQAMPVEEVTWKLQQHRHLQTASKTENGQFSM